MRAFHRVAAHAAGIFLLLTGTVEAQQADGQAFRRWSLSLTVGWAANDATGEALAEAMIRGGFNDRSPASCFIGLCAPSQRHPRTLGSRSAVPTIGLGYLATRWLEIRALWAPGGRYPETLGYRNDGSPFGVSATLIPSLQTVALIPIIVAADVIHLGAGPSLNFATLTDAREQRYSTTRPGVVVYAGLRLPPATRFFIELTGQYRYVTTAEFGSIAVPTVGGGTAASLPGFAVDYSYAVLAVGLGLRL